MEFSITKKGYSPKEVDEYIAAIKREYENTIIKQRDRISAMLEEKAETEKELESYRAKSNQISKAIVSAVAKAEEIEKLSRIKYSQEITRLKAFHEKWTKYYDKILEEYPLDARLNAAGEFNRRMDKILARVGCDDDVAATADKSVRTDYVNAKPPQKEPEPASEFDPLGKIDRYFAAEKEQAAKNKPAMKEFTDRSPSGFSFEEALNPTEDLESILKDLGLFSCD